MSEFDRVIGEASRELRERYRDYPDEFYQGEPHDVIHEIADSSVPVYTSDRFELIASEPNIAIRDLEWAEGVTDFVQLAGIAIFEAIEEALWETWREIEAERDEEAEAE